eukprot:gene351-370_t
MKGALCVFALTARSSEEAPLPPVEACNMGGSFGVDGTCSCYPTFTGPRCAQLALLPARTSRALYRPGVSSWGGSPLRDAAGRYHMVFADMVGRCGLSSWECNSAVGHAVAAAGSPEGPYQVPSEAGVVCTVLDTLSCRNPVQVVTPRPLLPPFGHNPTAVSWNDTWLLLRSVSLGCLLFSADAPPPLCVNTLYRYVYHIGEGRPEHPQITNCTGGVTGGARCGAEASSAASPDPPLKAGLPNVLYNKLSGGAPSPNWIVRQGDSNWALNNPTMYVFPNGTTMSVYKVSCNTTINPDPTRFCRQFALAVAPHPLEPFKPRGTIEVYGEDAHLWRCPHSGTFRILFQGGGYTPSLPQWKGHFHMAYTVDPDGLTGWAVAGHSDPTLNDTLAFNQTIRQHPPSSALPWLLAYSLLSCFPKCPDHHLSALRNRLLNGTSVCYPRRERHQLLLDSGLPMSRPPSFMIALRHASAHNATVTVPCRATVPEFPPMLLPLPPLSVFLPACLPAFLPAYLPTCLPVRLADV